MSDLNGLFKVANLFVGAVSVLGGLSQLVNGMYVFFISS